MLPELAVDGALGQEYVNAEIASRNLHWFVREAWHVVEPATPFMDNWHIQAICEHLEAVTNGQIRNLLINMPPRSAKSTTVSVMWPMWEWITHPERQWMFASYALSLAIRDSVKCRRLIESPWYQRHYGASFTMAPDQNLKSRYENDHRGYRMVISVNSGATGEGGDVIVVDDPHNVKDAPSQIIRQGTIEWWDSAISSRMNNPKTGAKVIVMQRVHEEDLSGHVIEKGDYVHLCLPMEYEASRAHTTSIGWRDPRTEEDALLWPARFGPTEVASLKHALGPYEYAGQYQQRPTPKEGGTFKPEWMGHRYQELPTLTRIIQAIDSAFKTGVGNDFSVIATWGTDGVNYYLLGLWRARVAYPDLIHAVRDQYALWNTVDGYPGVQAVLIEDKASGQSALQTLQRETDLPVIAVNAVGTKESRADDVSPLFQAGKVWLPDPVVIDAPWVADFVDEHVHFPRAAHDDIVDTSSYALRYLAHGRNLLGEVTRRIAMRQELLTQRGIVTQGLAHPSALQGLIMPSTTAPTMPPDVSEQEPDPLPTMPNTFAWPF